MSYSKELFYSCHRNLICKAIEELQFDEIFSPLEKDGEYKLTLSFGSEYFFKGRLGVWSNLQIEKSSLRKFVNKTEIHDFTINSFFKEAQGLCEMSDDTLSRYLEEANQTIFSDLKIESNRDEIQMKDFISLSFTEIDQVLPGHPKLIMNKGRIGWTNEDIQKYAPEFTPSFKLRWILAKKDICESGFTKSISQKETLVKNLSKEVLETIDFEKYNVLAVHPWQWDKYIAVQFMEEIACGDIVDLGLIGEEFTPQVSIRTLSQKNSKSRYDIKQSVSILNTSCVRGIPSKYIEKGYEISDFIESIVKSDNVLKNVEVLKEVGATRVKARYFDDIKGASYRYKELLGCVWRESVDSKLEAGERAIPVAALFYQGKDTSFIEELIKSSNINAQEWMESYFKTVVLPLYHLQVEHGLGLVAHGQNTILVLKDNCPTKLIIKDFHGDLRISTDSKHLGDKLPEVFDQLPPEYLIHDLITGHFITVLRYISRILCEKELLTEEKFYGILGNEINNYINEREIDIPSKVNLLRESFEKVLVNKVRFVAGYDETNTRLKPVLGRELQNPLRRYL